MYSNRKMTQLFAIACGFCVAANAFGGAHTWRVNEAYSNADGTIQFVELKEAFGGTGEIFLGGATVSSDSTGKVFTFPGHLSGNTANRHILLATAGFAALPGAPTPDHIIADNFIGLEGDTLRYHVYDAWTIGALPTDCILSINKNRGVQVNSPTNYSNQTGQITGCPKQQPCPGDATNDSNVNVNDLLAVINSWGPCVGCPADVTDDDQVNVNDLLAVINNWGPCR